MNLKRIITNEYVYSVITKLMTICIGIVQSILIARFLGTQLRGINAYISSIASIGSIIITFGMHQAYPYFRKKMGKEGIYSDYISLISILYIFLFAIGFLLAVSLPVDLSLKSVFILIPLLGYSRIIDYVLLIEKPNVRNTWWTIISVIDILYVALLWLFTNRNILWAISILLFADTVKCVVYTCVLKIKIHLSKKMYPLLVELIKYGFFPMIALLMTTLNYRIDVLMLHQYTEITDSMIGIYSLGLSLSDKIVLIPDTLKGILVSKLSKGASEEEVAKASRIGLWSSFLVATVILLVGRPVISFLYGVEYLDAYPVLVITSFGIISVVYFKFISQYNIVNKQQKVNVTLLSVAIIIDIVLNYLFIPIWGINGAALATSIGNFICGIVFIMYFCQKTEVSPKEMIFPQRTDYMIIKKLLHK